MLAIVALLAVTVYQVSAGAVELLPTAQVAPVASALVTARSSQYFAQNHNALASPVVAPVAPVAPVAQYVAPAAVSVSQVARYAVAPEVTPVAQYVAPVASSFSQVAQYAAPVAQYVAPVARYVAPPAFSYSQVSRYASPVAQYVAPFAASAPLVQANVAVGPAAPLIANPASFLASPVLNRAPLALASAQPVAAVQPVAPPAPPQPGNPTVQAQNPDDESIEIESARIRSLPQARNQPQPGVARSQQGAFPQQNLAAVQQNLLGRFQQQAQQNAENARFSTESVAQARRLQPQGPADPSARNAAQQQQAGNRALAAAPGLLSAQQYIQAPYLG